MATVERRGISRILETVKRDILHECMKRLYASSGGWSKRLGVGILGIRRVELQGVGFLQAEGDITILSHELVGVGGLHVDR